MKTVRITLCVDGIETNIFVMQCTDDELKKVENNLAEITTKF